MPKYQIPSLDFFLPQSRYETIVYTIRPLSNNPIPSLFSFSLLKRNWLLLFFPPLLASANAPAPVPSLPPPQLLPHICSVCFTFQYPSHKPPHPTKVQMFSLFIYLHILLNFYKPFPYYSHLAIRLFNFLLHICPFIGFT